MSVASSQAQQQQQQQTTQLVIGPDGRYSYVLVNHSAYPQGQIPHPAQPPPHRRVLHQPQAQHVVHSPHGTYVTSVPPTANNTVHYWSHAPPPHAHSQHHSA